LKSAFQERNVPSFQGSGTPAADGEGGGLGNETRRVESRTFGGGKESARSLNCFDLNLACGADRKDYGVWGGRSTRLGKKLGGEGGSHERGGWGQAWGRGKGCLETWGNVFPPPSSVGKRGWGGQGGEEEKIWLKNFFKLRKARLRGALLHHTKTRETAASREGGKGIWKGWSRIVVGFQSGPLSGVSE